MSYRRNSAFRPRRVADPVAAGILWAMALLVSAALVWMLADIFRLGAGVIDTGFLLGEPRDAGRAGGIFPMIVATLWILAICLAVVVPLGLATAVAISEYLGPHGRLRQAVLRSLDVLSGVPSIVFGLFGYAFFAQVMGLGFSLLSGGLSLACMALPLFVRVSAQALLMVPDHYRQAAHALGLSHTGYLVRILLPQAAPGIAAGIILSTGRALAETAVLLFTAGYVMRMPGSALDSGRALAVHIYDLSMNVSGGDSRAAGTALVLVCLLLLVNGGTRWLLKEKMVNP